MIHVFLLWMTVATSGQGGDVLVRSVRVEGLTRVSPRATLLGLSTKEGEALDEALITADLRHLWAKGFFRDVQAFKEPHEGGGWDIIFQVREKPSIARIVYDGRSELSEDDVKEVVDVHVHAILDEKKLTLNDGKIKKLYSDEGYYLAEVSHEVRPVIGKDNEVVVAFVIHENIKVTVGAITFVGNHNMATETIRNSISTRVGNLLSLVTQSGKFKEEEFQVDLMRIQAMYFDNGYITAKVETPEVNLSQDRRFVYITIPIEEGKQYRVGEITFGGDIDLPADEKTKGPAVGSASLAKLLTLKKGEIFSRSVLQTNITRITDVYRDRGFAYANINPNSKLHDAEDLVDFELEIQRGEVVRIGRVEVTGNTRTRDRVIRRQMHIDETELFSAARIAESKARIFQLGFFETVEVNTQATDIPGVMNVVVEVKEKQTGTFQIGAGFSSLEKFIATAQIAQNNFLGRGQSLSLSAQLSFGNFARQLVTLNFFEPYCFDTLFSCGVNAYVNQQLLQDFQRNARGGSPSFGYQINPDLRVQFSWTFEHISLQSGVSSTATAQIRDLFLQGFNSAPRLSLSYDTRDNRLFPTKGQFHLLTAEVSDRGIGSSHGLEYRRMDMTSRFYRPLFWEFVLRVNAQLGLAWGRGENPVPISERYFPGGIFSVRGFQPRGLGPSKPVSLGGYPSGNTIDFIVGGNKQLILNVEIEFPILKAAGIRGVVFADAGNAYAENENMFYIGGGQNTPKAYLIGSNKEISPPLGLYYSFGFGFRWFSPIGPLRFEWGIPITKRHMDDRGVLFAFTIGNMF